MFCVIAKCSTYFSFELSRLEFITGINAYPVMYISNNFINKLIMCCFVGAAEAQASEVVHKPPVISPGTPTNLHSPTPKREYYLVLTQRALGFNHKKANVYT